MLVWWPIKKAIKFWRRHENIIDNGSVGVLKPLESIVEEQNMEAALDKTGGIVARKCYLGESSEP